MSGQASTADGHRIVVGVDGSESSKEALRWALGQARLTGALLEAVIAWEYPAAFSRPMLIPDFDYQEWATQVVTKAIDEVASDAERVTHKVVMGNAARVLLKESDGADMLVVGNRGHAGYVEALLGSTGQHCVHYATCPVVVVRGSEVA
jgi:nucleotide-binding universal stress UspA family protein